MQQVEASFRTTMGGRIIRLVDSLEAELWALRDGLQVAITMHLTPLEVEVDAQLAIQLIT